MFIIRTLLLSLSKALTHDIGVTLFKDDCGIVSQTHNQSSLIFLIEYICDMEIAGSLEQREDTFSLLL